MKFLFISTIALSLAIASPSKTNPESSENLAKIKALATKPQEALVTERTVHTAPPHLLVMLQRKHPHVYLEVLKIKEQVMVDKNLKPIKKNAIASEKLFRVHQDGRKSVLRSRLYLLAPQHSVQAQHRRHELEDDDELDWFDRLALALHLDHFWPRLLFSLSTGFAIVALGFLILNVVCMWLGYGRRGDGEDDYAALLDPNIRGPGTIRVSNQVIEKSASLD